MIFYHPKIILEYYNLSQFFYFKILKMRVKKLCEICTYFQLEGVESQN